MSFVFCLFRLYLSLRAFASEYQHFPLWQKQAQRAQASPPCCVPLSVSARPAFLMTPCWENGVHLGSPLARHPLAPYFLWSVFWSHHPPETALPWVSRDLLRPLTDPSSLGRADPPWAPAPDGLVLLLSKAFPLADPLLLPAGPGRPEGCVVWPGLRPLCPSTGRRALSLHRRERHHPWLVLLPSGRPELKIETSKASGPGLWEGRWEPLRDSERKRETSRESGGSEEPGDS